MKISPEQKEQIRLDYQSGEYTKHELATKHRISYSSVCSIFRNSTEKRKANEQSCREEMSTAATAIAPVETATTKKPELSNEIREAIISRLIEGKKASAISIELGINTYRIGKLTYEAELRKEKLINDALFAGILTQKEIAEKFGVKTCKVAKLKKEQKRLTEIAEAHLHLKEGIQKDLIMPSTPCAIETRKAFLHDHKALLVAGEIDAGVLSREAIAEKHGVDTDFVNSVEEQWSTTADPEPTPANVEDNREQLARRVADVFQSAFTKLAEHKEDVEQLWKEFKSLKTNETILGCKTKTEFCEKVLHRSPRAVQYMLNGGNPVSKRKRRETVSHPSPEAVIPENEDSDETETVNVYLEHPVRMLKNAVILREIVEAYRHDHDINSLIKDAENVIFTPDELDTASGCIKNLRPFGKWRGESPFVPIPDSKIIPALVVHGLQQHPH